MDRLQKYFVDFTKLKIGGKLGKGGQGEVSSADYDDLWKVAIKKVAPELLNEVEMDFC
jgi:hypothetical protein